MQKVSGTHSPPHLQSTIVTTAALLHLLYINIFIFFFLFECFVVFLECSLLEDNG